MPPLYDTKMSTLQPYRERVAPGRRDAYPVYLSGDGVMGNGEFVEGEGVDAAAAGLPVRKIAVDNNGVHARSGECPRRGGSRRTCADDENARADHIMMWGMRGEAVRLPGDQAILSVP